MPSKIRKGGRSRFVLNNAVVGDTFILPRGNRLTGFYVENINAPQVQTLTVAGGPIGVAPSVLTINGVDFLTGSGIIAGDTIATFVTKVLNNATAQVALAKTGWAMTGNTVTGILTLTGKFTSVQSAVAAVSTSMTTLTLTGTATVVTAPTFSVSSTPLSVPVQTLTITGTALSANPTVWTIAGAVFLGAGLASGDTVATVITKTLAYTPGLNTLSASGLTLEGNPSAGTLTLRSTYARSLGAQSVTATTFTGLTVPGTFTQVIAGASAGVDVVTSQSLSLAYRNVADQTSNVQAGKAFVGQGAVSSYTYTFTGSSSTAGSIYIAGVPYNLGSAGSQNAFAALVGALNIPGFTLSVSTNTVTFTQVASGAGYDIPTVALGTITGMAIALTASTQADAVYYLNIVPTTYGAVGPGQYNFYAMLEKFN